MTALKDCRSWADESLGKEQKAVTCKAVLWTTSLSQDPPVSMSDCDFSDSLS